jgi:hypothetical protein
VLRYLPLVALTLLFIILAWGMWKLRDRFEILGEFLSFLRERKLWWIIPLVLVFVVAGLFVLITSQSAIAGFIYTLF